LDFGAARYAYSVSLKDRHKKKTYKRDARADFSLLRVHFKDETLTRTGLVLTGIGRTG
jgi:hypothetical protein